MKNKRIKLTDEQIAIGMWVYIYLNIKYYREGEHAYSVAYLKLRYLDGRDVHWMNSCLLCQRYDTCNVCPLFHKDNHNKCSHNSYYDKACSYFLSEKHRRRGLISAKKILQVMIEEEKKHGKA